MIQFRFQKYGTVSDVQYMIYLFTDSISSVLKTQCYVEAVRCKNSAKKLWMDKITLFMQSFVIPWLQLIPPPSSSYSILTIPSYNSLLPPLLNMALNHLEITSQVTKK